MASKKEVSGGVLRYDDTPLSSKFPLVAVITSKLVPNIKLVGRKGLENTEFTVLGSHDSLQGSYVSAKYLARANPQLNLYGSDAFSASKIDQWIERIGHMSVEKIGSFVDEINEYLSLRTFLVGFNITLADITLFSKITLVKEYQEEITKKQKTVPHLNRWKSYLDTQTAFKDTVTLYSGGKVSVEKTAGDASKTEKAKPQKSAMGWVGNFDALNLPGLIEGKVVTRFPPEPSGYMHVGHCKAAIINNYYAEKYKGKIVLRFDDTNPEKEKQEFVDNIKGDIDTLGIKYCRITFTSDYFQLIMDIATKMIKDGIAYVDDTPKEIMSQQKADGIESAARSHSVEKNLEMWKEMQNGTELGQKCVLRAKIDMQHVDKAFRDPPIYRCNVKKPHYRTGDKFKCYPLYDFACPIVDSIEGITHALRSNEYHNKIDQYYHFVKILNLEHKPVVSDYSRLSFDYTVLSKRKLQEFVEEKKVDGWFDPRLPTLQGMLRRGVTIEALKDLVITLGASAATTSLDMGKLWARNKEILETTVPRFSGVARDGAVPFTLSNGPEKPETREIPKYNKEPKLGNKKVVYSSRILLEADDAKQIKSGEEITLMNWGNAIVESIQTDNTGKIVSMAGKLHLEGDFKKTEKKLTWISDDAKKVPILLTDYDYIISKAKLDKDDDIKNFMNPNTKFTLDAIGDENILGLQRFDKIQLERRGFFNVDKVGNENEPYVLVYIPDSKHKPQGTALHPFVPKESKPTTPATKPAPKKK